MPENLNKFYIKKRTEEENKNGEKYIVQKLNHYKKGVNKEEIKKYIKKAISSIPEGFEFKITTLTSDNYKSSRGGWDDDKDDPEIYDPEVYYGQELATEMLYYSAMIVVRRKRVAAGGSDNKYNDCLYYCLKDRLRDSSNFTWSYPSGLKQFLGLFRDEKVNVRHIPKLEDKLKSSIRVCGDVNFNSGSTYTRIINLRLSKGHFTIENEKGTITKKLINKVRKSKTDNEIMVFTHRLNNVLTYNGERYEKVKSADFYAIYKKMFLEKYFYVRCKVLIDDTEEQAKIKLSEEYERTLKDATEIKNNGINPLLFHDLKCCIMHNAYYGVNNVGGLKQYHPEQLNEHEAKWIKDALTGGLISAKKGTYKNVKCLDAISLYPYLLSQTGLMIPLNEGEFERVNELNKIIPFGIYRAKITGKINPVLFRVNKRNKYTHYDLYTAREQNYNIELIQDGQVNALIYNSKNRATSKQLFKPYMEYFFSLKKKLKGNRMIKSILNNLWGALCETEHKTLELNKSDNLDLLKSLSSSGDKFMGKFYRYNYLYQSPLARLGPFLTSYGRKHMSKIMTPYADKILRVHTDGFIIDANVNIPTSDDLGDLKVEYIADKVIIEHVNLIHKL